MMLKHLVAFLIISSLISLIEAKSPPKDADLQRRDDMIELSKEIGVTCAHCHDTSNFKSDTMPAYKIGWNHIKFVNEANKSKNKNLGFKLNCYVCHRGQPKPTYSPPLDIEKNH